MQNWLICSSTCPLRNLHADVSQWAEVKGMDDVLDTVRVHSGSTGDSDGSPSTLVPTPPDLDGEINV